MMHQHSWLLALNSQPHQLHQDCLNPCCLHVGNTVYVRRPRTWGYSLKPMSDSGSLAALAPIMKFHWMHGLWRVER